MPTHNICPRCQGYMLQNQDAVEFLKCNTCAYGHKKAKNGRACNNCQCINGFPCIRAVAEEVMNQHRTTLKKLA